MECLEAGVFRADIPAKFNLVPTALQQLIGNIDRDLTFTLETEHGIQVRNEKHSLQSDHLTVCSPAEIRHCQLR